jgi:4-oxalocrotonate tautomerase
MMPVQAVLETIRGRHTMPIVTVENAGELSTEKKTELIKKITEVVVKVTGKPAQYVYVRIDEVPPENFGVGGEPLG